MIFKTLSTETRLKRIVASIVAFSFLLSNIAFAETPKSNIAPDIKKPTEVVTDPEKIVISRDYGLVKSKFTGKDKKLVIHIQDAHCNYEAQSNIAKILESLIKNDGLSLVSVEGADGFIDTSWFKAFPDADIRKEVADYFMKKGEITGPELLSITTDYPIKLFGAETRSYYIENLNAFTTSYPLKEDTERYFNQIKAIINKLKTSIYSAELKDLDSKMQDYESKKLQFSDYVKFLETLAQEHKINLRQYENIFKLISVFIYEKRIDFKVVDKERSTLIDEITKKLDKDALADLVARSLAFKTSKISSAEYYDYLKKLAMHHGFDMMKDYPNLANYIIYNSVYSRIENEKLFNDIKALELAIKEKLFTNDDQRTLEKLSRHIDILLGLTNIKLLNGDFDYYKTNKDGFTHEVFADFIKKMAAKYGFAFELDSPSDAVKESLPKLEDFYAIAIKRDKALVDNTIQAMKKESAQICVLVTGGFHSEGITKLLEQQGLSYMVICPNITKDVETPYIKILTNQRTPMEEILTDSGVPVDAKAKQGMLAPLLATWAAPLDEDQIERLLSDVPFGKVDKDDLKRLVDGIVARMSDTKRNFEFKSIEKWIERALNVAYSHRYSHDISTIKDAYAFSMKTDLVNKRSKEKGGVALTTAEKKAIDKFVDALIGSKDFDSIFSDAHQSAFQRYVVHQEPSANQQHVMEGLVAESNRAKGTRSSSSGYDKTTPDDASRAKAVGATLSDDIIDKAISDPYTKYKVILDNGSVPANISAADPQYAAVIEMLRQTIERLDDKVFKNILRSPHVNAAADSALAKAFTKDNLLKLLKPGSGFSIKLIQPKDEVEGVRIPAIIITSSGSNYGHYSTKHDCAYLPWGLIDMLLDLKVSEPKIVGDALHEMAEYLIVKQAFPGKTVVEKISGDVEESRAHYAAQLLEIAVSGATTRDKEAIMGPRSALDDLLEDVTEDYLNKLKGEGIDNAHACFNSDAFIRYSGEQINHRVGRLHKKIEKLIHEYRDIDALLAAERHKEKQDAAKQSELEIKLSAKEAEINKIIDEVNKFTKVASDKFNTSAPLTVSVDEKDKEAARALIIKGGYVPQFLFAGAADRLNQKLPSELRAPMCMQYSWPITRACIENFIRYYKKARDAFNSSSGEKQSKASADQRKWLELLNNTLLALGKPEVTGEKVMKINDKWVDSLIPKDAIEGLTIGAKQLINFRLQLEELAGPESAAEVIKRQKIILHVNAESEDHVTRDLIANNFYGFEHQNIFIVSQPEFHGFDIVKGKAVYVENSRALPAGHGYVTQQVAIPDQAYYIITDAAKGKTPVKIGLRLYKYLEDLGCKLVDTYRINDLEKYSYNTLDLDSIAMSMKLIKRNKNLAVVELVGNPDMQKGGNFFTDGDKHKFLLETLNAKTNDLIIKLTGPYNAFRIRYDIRMFDILAKQGLPFSIRFRGGYLYLEGVTGDLTQVFDTNTEAIMVRGAEGQERLIQDFKEEKNLPLAVKYFLGLDRNPKFIAMLKKVKAESESPVVTRKPWFRVFGRSDVSPNTPPLVEERKVHFYFSDSTEVDFTKWEFRGRNELVLKTDHSVVAVKGQDGIFVKPADYRENKGDTRESASGVRIPGGVEDVIKLDKGPADTNWWEQATMAELTKNPTPWGEDKIVPVDEQKGVIKIEITREMLKDYSEENPEGRNILQSFEKMAELGPKSIAGIRHIMNILNVHDTRQVKNSFERLLTTVSLGLMIKILYNKGENFPYMANYGHEVRYHSNTFQKITTRALAAMGFITHVVPNNKATAIWNTSTMGKFFNFVLSFCGTSSHSESEIDGLKIIDYEGSQFLIENIEAMIAIQKAIIDKIEKDGKFVFTLSSEDDPRITDKLYQLTNNGMFVYKQYQEKTTADEVVLGLIKAMDPAKIHIDCAHGAGYGTLTAFFKEIGISGVTDKIGWMHTEEKPDFGNIGKLMENPKNGKKEIFDLGADVTQVYEKVLPNGKVVKYFPVLCTADYPEKFAAMPIGDVVLHTDMDNDRLAVSQVLSNDVETRKLLERLGVVYNVINEEKLVAMFIPNKFFHFLHEINFNRITELMKEGTVDPNRKIVVLKTLASTPAVDKWAEARRNEGYNIEVVNTAVGFAKLANVMYRIEGDMRTAPGKDVIISDAAGKDINVGSNPIILAAWEESGGIIVGVIYGFKDILGNSFLSAREKSATESIFLSLALLSKLQQEMGNVDLSVYLDQLYTRDSTDTPIDIRFDNKLFTPGASKEAAEAEKAGNKRKDRIFGAFLSIVITYMRHELNLEEAKVVLRDIFNQEYEARKKLGEQAPVLTERYKNVDIDSLIDIQFTGDGVMFVFEKAGRKWFVLFRPSGTEPKNKSYGFGENPDTLTIDAWAFSFTENIAGALPGSFTSNKSLMNIWGTDGVKAIDKAQRMQVAWEKYGLVVDPTDPQDMKRLGVTKKDLKKRELVREFNPPDDHLKIIQDWLRQEGLGELDIDVSSNPAMPQEDIVALLKSIPEEVYEKLGRTKEEVLNKEEGGIISRQSASGIGIDTSWAPFARAMDNDTWKNMPAVIRTMAAKTGLWANFVDAGKVMLGWMTLSEWRKKDNIMPPMREFADQVRKEKAEGKTTDIVFVGQGGSVEAIKTLYGILGNDANSPKVHIMDTVDPEAVSDVKKLPLNTTRFVIISKSMTTMEVHSFYKLFYDLYVERNIPDSKNHFTLITDQGKAEVENGVLKVAEKVREPFRTEALSRGFLNVFYIEPCSGGRYSWDTAVGVLPALIMGQDVDQILEGARSIEERAKNMDLRENPMAQYGAFKYGMHMQGRNRPTLMLPSEVKPYGPWDGQLDTESLGKTSDQSSLTIDHEELAKDPRVYTNKRFFVRIKLGYQDFRLDAEVRNLERAGLPVYTITLLNSAPGNVSPKDLGALLKMSEFATVIAGHLMGETTEKINPVNQAGVEEYKKAQQVYIAEPYVENPKYVAVTENGNVKLDYRASVENKGKITQRMLNDVLKRLGRTDKNDVAARYAALLYLSARNMGRDYATMMIFKRLSLNPELGRILDEWRYGVRDTLMIDTLGEEAPCILHAKQQGFQKGEPSGNFTVVRFAKYNGEDIVIPGSEETYGQPKTFQDLIKAQAIGSLQALSNATETNAKGKEVNANRLGAMIELKDEKPETVAEFGKIVKESVALLSELVERDNRSKAIVEHMVAEEVSESSGKTHIYERSSASGRVAPTEAEVDLLTGVVKAPQSLSAMDISVVTDADIKALESTLLSLGTNKDALAKDGKVMIIWDTAISDNDNTNAAAQQTAKLIDERLGEGAAIHIRGNGENSAKLLAEVDRYLKSENVRAIVTIAGDKTLKAPAPIGGTVEEALQKLHEKSKVLNVQSKDTEGPLFIQVPALYNLALSIGYEMGEERIIQCLQSIGIVVDDNGKPIDPMSILTEKIVRILPKIRPVDMNADTLAQTLARKALETSL